MLIIAAFNILSVDLKRAWAKGFAACNEIGEMECGKRDIAADLFSLLKTPSPAALEPERTLELSRAMYAKCQYRTLQEP